MSQQFQLQDKRPTAQLSSWVHSTKLEDVPERIVGAHLPWTEKAVRAICNLEPGGETTIFGWCDRKIGPLSAALLNSTFIQGFELDDWHSEAPLHSNSILLPALLAAAQHVNAQDKPQPISGSDILLATIVGYEVGPRVGLALYGSHVLTTGWHSGAVFGPAASAAAVGRLLSLTSAQIEDALGIACTQSCGLMSAQFGSDVKRMQHGFAARNGLLAAFLARGGFTGIKGVFEQEYGGFLQQFSSGNGKSPQYLPKELNRDLGIKWQVDGVRVKPYASMAGTHPTVDCVRGLQERFPEQMRNRIHEIKKINIKLGEAAFHHGGWKATRPLTSTGAQMSNSYVAATQIIHRHVLPAQFRHDMLENEEVWRLVDLTDCEMTDDFGSFKGRQTVTIEFADGTVLEQSVVAARGVQPPLSNDEIVDKWRQLMKGVIDDERVAKIESLVLSLEECSDILPLIELMAGRTENPIE
ncbi:2-methylcitrate dehydratase PrpD [Thozetella sp. PMI_491]|nr:2-methylcitrate dehydratase PrpD [Thozetella sp. PMI_491]